jgi:hypothetical protein
VTITPQIQSANQYSGSARFAARRPGTILVLGGLFWLFLSLPAWAQEDPYNQQSQPEQQSGYGQQTYPDSGQPNPQQDYGQAVQPLNAGRLEQLVAPIALYPDALVAQILGASTYPAQVSDADRWRQAQGYASPDQIAAGADAQNWDPSVKALTAFPQVLTQMDRNLQWTTDLGNAYYNQPQDVLEAVQVMRHRAQAAGNLQSTPQEEVRYDQGNIELAPVNPQVVYVPAYNPWTVYGSPISPYPGFSLLDAVGSVLGAVRFGLGIGLGAFMHTPFGWLAWGLDWLGHAIFFHQSPYYSHSASVAHWGFSHYGFHAYAGREGFGRPGQYAMRGGEAWRRGASDRSAWHEFSRAPETHAGNWGERGSNTNRGSHFENRGTRSFSGTYNPGAYNRGAYDHEAYNHEAYNHEAYNRGAYSHEADKHDAYNRAGSVGRPGGFDRGYEARSFGPEENHFAEQSSRVFAGQRFSNRNSGSSSFSSREEKSGGHHWFGSSHAPKNFAEKGFGGGKAFGNGKAFGGGKNFGGRKISGGHSGGHGGGGGKHHR